MSEIIYNASKGSKFFTYEQARDQALTEKIERILARKQQIEATDLSAQTQCADAHFAQLETVRDLSQYVVHVDCDAFYAAVEELDRPELRNLPMAVGKGVLSTCNYHARKFGCRSGMACFIAKKLCPDLILLPMNFEKYFAKSREIRNVLKQYDPDFYSASVDEAYMNITEYCAANGLSPETAVQNMRDQISRETGITVSAGIAPNTKLAKIASNWNKPNGQFRVANERDAVMNFIGNIPARKINGIGRVFERELDAIGIRYCRDVFPSRALLLELFGERAFQFLAECYLGLGRTHLLPAEAYERKSIGVERTFKDTSNMTDLEQKLRSMSAQLETELAEKRLRGRTLVLKVKLDSFEVLTRQMAPSSPVYKADSIFRHSLPMLRKLHDEIPGFAIRLMGLRSTHLLSSERLERMLSYFQQPKPADLVDDGMEKEAKELRAISESFDKQPVYKQHSVENFEMKSSPKEEVPESWKCPICLTPQPADSLVFNQHIDFCLSKQEIKEAVKETRDRATTPSLLPRKRKAGESCRKIEDLFKNHIYS